MPIIRICESCGEETVVERVRPGAPLKCMHCGFEEPGDTNSHAICIDAIERGMLGKR